MAGALVYTDNPGAIPATYVIPADGELRLSSIVARFNGAAAASAFFPCLSVYSLDGRLVGRFHPKTELAVGDTAVVTYAPFLRSEAPAAASASAFEWMRRRKRAAAAQSINSGSDTAVTWNSVDVSTASFFTSTGNGIRVEQDGLYALVCRLFWASDPGAHSIEFHGIDPDAFAGYPGGVVAQSSFNLIGMVATTARLEDGQTVTVSVRHTAGAARSIDTDGSYMEIRYLGDITTTGRDA